MNSNIRVSMHKALMAGLTAFAAKNEEHAFDVARAAEILTENGARAGLAQMIESKAVHADVINECVGIYDSVNQKRREYEIINTYRNGAKGAGDQVKNDKLAVGLKECGITPEPTGDLAVTNVA